MLCVCVRPSMWHIIQKNIKNEFQQHSRESRGFLGQAGSKQAGKQAGKQEGKQASKQASEHANKQGSKHAIVEIKVLTIKLTQSEVQFIVASEVQFNLMFKENQDFWVHMLIQQLLRPD